ncbi:helix-turn-helix domain-containing protein [Halomonas casei]|uniref:helix-turn-helix domain-containing protein n=1 Tax=Halomonas casei TaxID=2742613 RepID=UPI003CF38E83
MFSKPDLKIEKLGHETLKVLDRIAAQNGVSREQQAVGVLNAWASPAAVSANDKSKLEVAKRLSFGLSELQGIRGERDLTPSILAEKAGLSGPDTTIAALHAASEIDFELLEKLAVPLNVNPNWLKHGEGVPYPAPEVRLSYAPGEAVNLLLAPNEATGQEVTRIYFLRSDDELGALKIVRRFGGSTSCEMFSTPYHVSEAIGAGGEGDLCALFNTFKHLYEVYTSGPVTGRARNTVIKSFLLDKKYFRAGEAQHVHPLRLLELATECPWWEDIWDERNYSGNSEHWEGFGALRSRILRANQLKNQA